MFFNNFSSVTTASTSTLCRHALFDTGVKQNV